MKLNLILASAILTAGFMTSCSLDDAVSENTIPANISQLIIPDDPAKDVTVQKLCSYSLKMDEIAGTVVITSSDFSIGSTSGSLTTSPVKFNYATNGIYYSYYFQNAHGKFGTNEVSDVTGFLTTLSTFGPQQPVLVLGYHVDGYTVRTFALNTIFSGTTKTTYNMGAGEKTYESEEPQFAISFSEDMTKATVTLLNIRFAEEMPKTLEAVILRDLPVTLDRNGYTISGSVDAPEVKEGSSTTPNPNYPFKSIIVKNANPEMTEITCDYVVAFPVGGGRTMDFLGEFKGNYADYYKAQ